MDGAASSVPVVVDKEQVTHEEHDQEAAVQDPSQANDLSEHVEEENENENEDDQSYFLNVVKPRLPPLAPQGARLPGGGGSRAA